MRTQPGEDGGGRADGRPDGARERPARTVARTVAPASNGGAALLALGFDGLCELRQADAECVDDLHDRHPGAVRLASLNL